MYVMFYLCLLILIILLLWIIYVYIMVFFVYFNIKMLILCFFRGWNILFIKCEKNFWNIIVYVYLLVEEVVVIDV